MTGLRGIGLKDLASKMRSLSLTLEDVEIVERRLKSFHDPEGNLKVSSTRIATAVKECEFTLKLVTKYSGKLEATLEQSMFKKVLYEWRDDFSGKAALDKALKDIDDRKGDIQSAIHFANLYVIIDIHSLTSLLVTDFTASVTSRAICTNLSVKEIDQSFPAIILMTRGI